MRPRATFSSLMGLAAESMTGGSALNIPSRAESTSTPDLRLVQAAPSMKTAHSDSVAQRRMSSSVNEYTPRVGRTIAFCRLSSPLFYGKSTDHTKRWSVPSIRLSQTRRWLGIWHRVGQRNDRPNRAALRNPLIVVVREAALEIRLEPGGPRLHVPGAVRLLDAQQILDAMAVDGVAGRHAGLVERVERLAGGIRVAGEVVGLAPSAIGALQSDQLLDAVRRRLAIGPAGAQQLHGAVFGGDWGVLFQPCGRARDAFLEFGLAAGDEIKLQRPYALGGVLEAAIFERRARQSVGGIHLDAAGAGRRHGEAGHVLRVA